MKIKKNNILPIDKYINEALYGKEFGYYIKKNPFGKTGDYITAPNISILFSEMIAIWIIDFWQNLNFPEKFNLIELGAGNGEMMKQMLAVFKRFPKFKECCKINILEKSCSLKEIQKQKLKNANIKWLKNLNEINNIPNLFVANEFFDALPIKQFIKKKDKWFERNVKFSESEKPRFVDILKNIKQIEKKIGFKISAGQKFIEYSPLLLNYLKIISKKINNNTGGILIIDYGYYDKKMKNTLKSISKHKFNDVLSNFGKADITYDINYNFLEKVLKKNNLIINGRNNQKNFLTNLGILKRAEIITKKLPFSKKADIYYRVKTLIDNKSMGEVFKVIFATSKKIDFKTGFIN